MRERTGGRTVRLDSRSGSKKVGRKPREPRKAPRAGERLLRLPTSAQQLRNQNTRTIRRESDHPARRPIHFRRPRKFSLTGSDLPVLFALPIALVVAGYALALLGFVDLYAEHKGFLVAATPTVKLVDTSLGEEQAKTDSEPLSIDASVFEKIKRTVYTVQRGDTISEIAYRFGIDPGTILSMNPVDDVRRLLPGTELSIPNRDGLFYAVQPGDSISAIAKDFGVTVAAILDANDLSTSVLSVGDSLFIPGVSMDEDEYLLAIGELFQWPLARFRMTSGYGMRDDPITGEWRMHTGVDLANVIGTPVLAAKSGRVVHVQPNAGDFGNLIILSHTNGFQTLYAHLSRIDVKVGQYVSAGQVIGRVGNTGRSTGPHLHFSVIRNRQYQDPLKNLPPR